MRLRARMTKKQMLVGVGRTDIKDTCMLARNVLRYTLDGVVHVRYCDTDIIKVDKTTGNTTITSGGFYSRTTKRHLNHFQNIVTIIQRNFTWYIVTLKPPWLEQDFFDGMTISPDGSVLN